MSVHPADYARELSKAGATPERPSTDVKTQCPYPTTSITDYVKKNSEAKSALKELGSELQKEGSEVAKPSTSVTPPTKVEGVKKTQEEKQKDTAQAMSR